MRSLGDQAGEVADQAGGPVGVGAQLGDDRGGLAAADLGPLPASRDPMVTARSQSTMPSGALRLVHAMDRPGRPPTVAAGEAAAAASSASRAASVLTSGTRSATSTKVIGVPSRSVATPARR